MRRALLASAFFGLSDFLGGTLSRKLPMLTVLFLSQIVAVLASLYPVVTALLGWRFHNERLMRVQLWGLALVLAGVATIAATS